MPAACLGINKKQNSSQRPWRSQPPEEGAKTVVGGETGVSLGKWKTQGLVDGCSALRLQEVLQRLFKVVHVSRSKILITSLDL